MVRTATPLTFCYRLEFRSRVRYTLRGNLVNAEALLSRHSSAKIIARLEANDVPCAKVKSRREALDDPQIIANGIVVEIDQPGLGRLRQARPAALFSETSSYNPRPAPALGQHTRDILMEVGFEDAEITAFINQGSVGAAAVVLSEQNDLVEKDIEN